MYFRNRGAGPLHKGCLFHGRWRTDLGACLCLKASGRVARPAQGIREVGVRLHHLRVGAGGNVRRVQGVGSEHRLDDYGTVNSRSTGATPQSLAWVAALNKALQWTRPSAIAGVVQARRATELCVRRKKGFSVRWKSSSLIEFAWWM